MGKIYSKTYFKINVMTCVYFIHPILIANIKSLIYFGKMNKLKKKNCTPRKTCTNNSIFVHITVPNNDIKYKLFGQSVKIKVLVCVHRPTVQHVCFLPPSHFYSIDSTISHHK